MEPIIAFIKTLHPILAVTAEVLLIIITVMVCLSLISGFWIALLILRKRANYIAEVSFMPPKITFHPKNTPSDSLM